MKTPTENYEQAKRLVETSTDLNFLKNALLEMMDNCTWYLPDIPALNEKMSSHEK